MSRPHDRVAEVALVGSLLSAPEWVLGAVDTEPIEFADARYRDTWTAALYLWENSKPVDISTILSEMQRMSCRTDGDEIHLYKVMNTAPSYMNCGAYAKRVREMHIRWQVVQAAQEATKLAFDDRTELQDVLAQSENALLGIRVGRTEANDADTVLDGMFRDFANPRAGMDRIFTGYQGLDGTTLGIEGGRFWVVAATPGTGKTTLAVNLVRGVCSADQDCHVLYLHPEQPEKEITSLLLSAGTDSIQPPRIKMLGMERETREKYARAISTTSAQVRKNLFGEGFNPADLVMDATEHEVTTLQRSREPLRGKVSFYDPSGENIHAIRRTIRNTRAELSKDTFLLVIMDGMHLIPGTGEGNRVQELTTITRGLKMAAQVDAFPGAIIAAHQLSYAGYPTGSNPGFSLRSLRDSGSIGQDADVVAFCWRPSVHGMGREDLITMLMQHGWKVPPGGWDYMGLVFKKNRQTSGLFHVDLHMNPYTMRVTEGVTVAL